MAHTYGPLCVEDGEFRLLELQPGSGEDMITCTMRSTSLAEQPVCQYETISYCWGDLAPEARLELDGNELIIPASAVAALRRVRLPDRTRLLFLDVLCIDQTNLEERAQQVSIMNDIYSSSAGNLIYLGEEDTSTGPAVRTIRLLYDEILHETDNLVALGSTVADPDTRNANRSQVGFRNRDELDFEALDSFFGLPRLWVTLETLVAPSNQALCGTHSFSLVELLRVSAWLHYKSFHIQKYVPNSINNRLWTWWVALDEQVDPVAGQCGGFQTFAQMLSYASSRGASDERDRVYALHKLFQGPLPPSLLPDYRRPLVELMCEATRRAFIDVDGNLDLGVLHHVHHASQQELELSAWPSWVPTWTEYHNDPGTFPESFCAGAHSPRAPDASDTDSSAELVVRGCVVGTVDTVTDALSDRVFQCWEGLDTWIQSVEERIDQWDRHRNEPSRKRLLSAVLEAATSENGTANQDPKTGLECLLQHLREKGIPPPALAPDEEDAVATRARSMYDKIWLYGIERLVFGTHTGSLGLGPALTRKGDVVVAVPGSPWPLVLRPHAERGFRFVGEAYVYGVMYGEAVKAHGAGWSGDEVFTIR
ncbi:uncharacterized protein LTR77_006482 [Saxophila tyrrhenica]|uniref:Heterokaryon incompatibility domain-containing protein n=1 Tax=Saxophila tyrrhenica TaxID=1690608 RepID=A0AAV9P8S5_9PEZI|nr:hypothetical protein LTR77_006482 [Saxophila tyrrhenica]